MEGEDDTHANNAHVRGNNCTGPQAEVPASNHALMTNSVVDANDAVYFSNRQRSRVSFKRKKTIFRRPKTRLEKLLAFLTTLFLATSVVLLVLLILRVVITDRKVTEEEVCMSDSCVHAASSILAHLDESVDPCQDFYQFACGSWLRDEHVPEDRDSLDIFNILTDKLRISLKKVIEAKVEDEDTGPSVKVKKFYKSCIDVPRIEVLGAKPLLDLIDGPDVGGWPVLQQEGDWDIYGFSVERLLARLIRYDRPTLVLAGVTVNEKNNTENIIQIDQGVLVLRREYYLNDTVPENKRYLDTYYKFMVDVLMLFERTDNRTHVEGEMMQVLEFEKKIANLTFPWAVIRTRLEERHNRMTIQEMQTQFPQMDWLSFFKTLMHPIEITEREPIMVRSPEYLKGIAELVHTTDKRVIANYMIWRFCEDHVDKLDSRFHKLFVDFVDFIHKITRETRPRWKDCIVSTNAALDMAVSTLYIKNNLKENTKEEVTEMIKDLQKAFVDLLDDLEWADEDTKSVSKDKVRSMTQMIAYPDDILDDDFLEKRYAKLELDETLYLRNVLKAREFNVKLDLKKLRDPVDKTKWYISPLFVNAYYYGVWNQIVFLAGILQPPFYDVSLPNYLNYGALGVVIGHEITHGFDDTGRKYNKHGNMTQWWKDEEIQAFDEKAKCFAEQYGQYMVDGVGHVNGNQTMGENIADNGGLKQAYYAYKYWRERNGQEKLLPGIDLTVDQLFYVSFAQVFCEIRLPGSMTEVIKEDNHTPGRYRVIGSVSNSHQFAEAFNCPRTAPMNPKEKCAVW